MKKMPISEISVFMTCFNASAFIEECMESVLTQSFEDFEFIIVDDGSTDDTVDKIKKFTDKRIKLFLHNHDYIQSLNLSVEISTGKYLAKMDADDIMMKDRLLIQYNYLEHHPDIDLLGGGMEYFGNGNGFYIPKVTENPINMQDLLKNNIIAHPTVMIRKSALQKLPCRYEQEFIYAEDYKLWLTMLEYGLKLDNIPDILLQYRQSKDQVSFTKNKQQQITIKRIRNIYSALLTVQ